MAYDLSDPLVFIGSELGIPVLQGFPAPRKDDPNPRNNNFVADAKITIGSAAQAPYSELKVFGGTIKGSLNRLIQDLRNQNLRVNRDGYCYIRIPGIRNRSAPRFLRLNDLFPWADYVDDASKYIPTPSSTIWNRVNSSNTNVKVVDYEKLDADLKKANNDNAVLINENNNLKTQVNAGNNDESLKKAKDEIDNLKTQVKDLSAEIDTINNNWHTAATIGARPLPPNTFNVFNIPRSGLKIIDNWIGKYRKLLSAPATADFNKIRPGLVDLYYNVNRSPFEFDPNFWWVVNIDLDTPSREAFNYLLVYYGGRHDAELRRNIYSNNIGIELGGSHSGTLYLDRLGYKFCFAIPTISL